MKNIPNTIFLNLGEDLEDFEDFNDLGEVTWCADKVGDGDIEYTRKPIWHDLRKNPDDLPLNYPNLISKSPSKMTHGSTKRVIAIYDDGKIRIDRMVKPYIRTQDGTKLEWVWLSYTIQKHVLAWMEIPKFKD